MRCLCLLLACTILVGCVPPHEGLVRPGFYVVVEKIPQTSTVVVWAEDRVYRIVLPPKEYEQVYVGQTGLVPVIWVE